MTQSVAYLLRQYLLGENIIQGANATLGTNVWRSYLGAMPTEPDNCVVILDTTPAKDGRLMSTGEVVEHFGVQFIVRSTVYPTGFAKIKEIEQAMDNLLRETVVVGVGSNAVDFLIHSVSRSSGVIPLGADPQSDQKREFFSLNVFATVNQQ